MRDLAPDRLSFVANDFVNLESGLYLWVDIKRFRLVGSEAPASDALDLLLRHPQYRDHYISRSSQRDDLTVHGPYRRSCISTDSFDLVERQEAIAHLEAFLALYGGPGEEKAADVWGHVRPLVDSASEIFRLRELGEEAHHDAGWVLDDFNELVFVDLAGGNLALLVAAGD